MLSSFIAAFSFSAKVVFPDPGHPIMLHLLIRTSFRYTGDG